MHNDVRQVSRIGGEMSAQLAEIGQSAMVEIAREPIGELGFAAALVCQREQLDCDAEAFLSGKRSRKASKVLR